MKQAYSVFTILCALIFLITGCVTGGSESGGGRSDGSVTDVTISTTTLSEGTQDEYYIGLLEASGGKTPYTWNLADGSLPAGITLSGSTGSLEGTPLESGEFFFDVQVEDNSSTPTEDTKRLLITVSHSFGTQFGEQAFGTAVFE